jgi:Fic family protein
MILWKQTVALTGKISNFQETLERLSGPERKLLDLVESQGRLTVAEAVLRTGVNRNTLRKRLALLVGKGFLILDGKGRGSAYRKR